MNKKIISVSHSKNNEQDKFYGMLGTAYQKADHTFLFRKRDTGVISLETSLFYKQLEKKFGTPQELVTQAKKHAKDDLVVWTVILFFLNEHYNRMNEGNKSINEYNKIIFSEDSKNISQLIGETVFRTKEISSDLEKAGVATLLPRTREFLAINHYAELSVSGLTNKIERLIKLLDNSHINTEARANILKNIFDKFANYIDIFEKCNSLDEGNVYYLYEYVNSFGFLSFIFDNYTFSDEKMNTLAEAGEFDKQLVNIFSKLNITKDEQQRNPLSDQNLIEMGKKFLSHSIDILDTLEKGEPYKVKNPRYHEFFLAKSRKQFESLCQYFLGNDMSSQLKEAINRVSNLPLQKDLYRLASIAAYNNKDYDQIELLLKDYNERFPEVMDYQLKSIEIQSRIYKGNLTLAEREDQYAELEALLSQKKPAEGIMIPNEYYEELNTELMMHYHIINGNYTNSLEYVNDLLKIHRGLNSESNKSGKDVPAYRNEMIARRKLFYFQTVKLYILHKLNTTDPAKHKKILEEFQKEFKKNLKQDNNIDYSSSKIARYIQLNEHGAELSDLLKSIIIPLIYDDSNALNIAKKLFRDSFDIKEIIKHTMSNVFGKEDKINLTEVIDDLVADYKENRINENTSDINLYNLKLIYAMLKVSLDNPQMKANKRSSIEKLTNSLEAEIRNINVPLIQLSVEKMIERGIPAEEIYELKLMQKATEEESKTFQKLHNGYWSLPPQLDSEALNRTDSLILEGITRVKPAEEIQALIADYYCKELAPWNTVFGETAIRQVVEKLSEHNASFKHFVSKAQKLLLEQSANINDYPRVRNYFRKKEGTVKYFFNYLQGKTENVPFHMKNYFATKAIKYFELDEKSVKCLWDKIKPQNLPGIDKFLFGVAIYEFRKTIFARENHALNEQEVADSIYKQIENGFREDPTEIDDLFDHFNKK
ncbi:MAG: hypothetical protein DKM50_02685 [Candidatus Margulisiibacteriota bacterium]|nr:MAG: hypothetical protein A2X42_07505 [Candidatus Margulisbacteria bacterium GWF2_38_17]PZM83199.1 MAG: hypothetical protein DKM50_02685 [Candidatus Margulisiibacteriota bacterium]HCY38139.1 hypothetical protein [Candidatus Margulisiibacteriota bacterium]